MVVTKCDVCNGVLIGTKEEETTSFYAIEIESEFADMDDKECGGWTKTDRFHICPACYETAKSSDYNKLAEHPKEKLLMMVKGLIGAGVLTYREEKNSEKK